MSIVENYKKQVLNGAVLSKEDALILIKEPIEKLSVAADEIRNHYCGNKFDICTIINAKSGKCSENCKFCAQSSFYKTNCETYPLLSKEEIIKKGKSDFERGVLRYSLVTSGKALSDSDIEKSCEAIKELTTKTNGKVCISMGLLSTSQYKKLKESGVSRVHNNLETSPQFFKNVCSTHSSEDKIKAINNAKEAGLCVCSGGIIGLGESIADRIDMCLEIRSLGVNSVPVNVLNPISGTPFENNEKLNDDELIRTIAVFRFLMPKSAIRLAGGRGLMKDHGRRCFRSGANAAISGDMLTTGGYTIESDLKMINELGFVPDYLD